MSENTPEQLAQEAADKQAKAEAKAKAKAEKDAAKAQAKADRAAAKVKAKEEKAAAKEKAKADKAQAKLDAKAAREANRQPAQNGIRRPKADTLCGKAWAVFDSLSNAKGSPVAIGEALPETRKLELNDGNVRAEYARWRKFHGVSGRIAAAGSEQAAA